jgi:hypothetical protein
MPQIRREQLQAFEQPSPDTFTAGMLEHLRQHFPRHAELFGERALRDVIEEGRKRAGAHGFTTRHELYLYIDLMVMLGSGFDTDTQLPWAAELLAGDGPQRIERLYGRAMEHLDRVVGPNQVFPLRTYSRLARLSWEDLEVRFQHSPAAEAAEQLLAVLWREKCDEIGWPAVRHVVTASQALAAERGVPSAPGVAAFAAYLFVFGHHVHRDPLYTAISGALDSEDAKRQPLAGLRRALADGSALARRAVET